MADPAITWSDARAAAAALKHRACIGHLATITSQEENDFIAGTFPEAVAGGYWLGGTQAPGSGEPAEGWGWITGEPFLYTNWATGEPNDYFGDPSVNEESLHFFPPFFGPQGAPGTWNDQNGDSSESLGGYVVEYECAHSVSGHVEVPAGGIVEKYSFSAIRHADGRVTGEWQVIDKGLESEPGQFKAHGNVTCFTIAPDGKTVWLGGVEERSDFDPFLDFTDASWTVVDNGEGAKAPPDEATDLTFRRAPGQAAEHCATGGVPNNIPLTPIVRGNVQVRP